MNRRDEGIVDTLVADCGKFEAPSPLKREQILLCGPDEVRKFTSELISKVRQLGQLGMPNFFGGKYIRDREFYLLLHRSKLTYLYFDQFGSLRNPNHSHPLFCFKPVLQLFMLSFEVLDVLTQVTGKAA